MRYFCFRLSIQKKAFTLFEVLGTLALIALIISLLASNFSFLDNLNSRPLEKYLKSIIKISRIKTFDRGVQTALYYDKENASFKLFDYNTSELIIELNPFFSEKTNSLTVKTLPEITFLPIYPESQNNSDSSFDVKETLDCLRFHPDASSSEALIEVDVSGKKQYYYLNPFQTTISESKKGRI